MKIMKTATEKRIAFRENLKSGHIMIAPGVGDALGAKIAEMAGIPALAMGGYSVSASRLGQPDVGLLSCTEMAEQLTGICHAVNIPIIADGDTGYGNALNIIRTEQMFEQAGAACIFFEDQAWPKRCGHMEGKQVIAAEEHAQKIRAAVDARFDKETMIMSRTDSRAVYGIMMRSKEASAMRMRARRSASLMASAAAKSWKNLPEALKEAVHTS